MTTSAQVLALVDSALSGDADRFRGVALQIAAGASRAKQHDFHDRLVRRLNEPAKYRPRALGTEPSSARPLLVNLEARDLAQLVPPDLHGAVEVSYPANGLDSMTLTDEVRAVLDGLLEEQRAAEDLLSAGLSPAHRLLLTGEPGVGKTTCASALAADLGIPLVTAHLHGMIESFLGDTAKRIASLFKFCRAHRAVYFIDEFDALGMQRGGVGSHENEMGRAVNTLLVQLDGASAPGSLFVAATNHPQVLDPALWRRFDAVVDMPMPSRDLLERAMRASLAKFDLEQVNWQFVAGVAADSGHSYATATGSCVRAAKRAVLRGRRTILGEDIVCALRASTPKRSSLQSPA